MNRRREKRRIANGGLPPRAVAADTNQQVPISPYGSKKPFYVDLPFKCEDCGSEEVWTAEQQKWYYEEAKGTLYATSKRCLEMAVKKGASAAAKKRVLAVRKGATWGK